MLAPWEKSYDRPRQHIKTQRHYFANKGPSSQSYGFSSSLIWMWELDYKESWAPKKWYFWTVVLEKILESPLDCKDIQPVPPKGNQSWIFIGRTDVEAETPVLWPPDAKNWLTGKDPDAEKAWRQWGSLAWCSPRGPKESDMTERLNWTDLIDNVFTCENCTLEKTVNVTNNQWARKLRAKEVKGFLCAREAAGQGQNAGPDLLMGSLTLTALLSLPSGSLRQRSLFFCLPPSLFH